MAKIAINDPEGTLYSLSSFKWIAEINSSAGFSGILPIQISLGDEVWVFEFNTCFFHGYVVDSRQRSDGLWEFKAIDVSGKLHEQYVEKHYVNCTPQDILCDLLAYQLMCDGPTDITLPVFNATGYLTEILTQLANYINGYWICDADDTLIVRRFGTFVNDVEGSILQQSLESLKPRATIVEVRGAITGGQPIVATARDDSLVNEYGEIKYVVTDPNIKDIGLAQMLATSLLDQFKRESSSGTVTVVPTEIPLPGDRLVINSVDYTVTKIELTEAMKAKLTLNRLPTSTMPERDEQLVRVLRHVDLVKSSTVTALTSFPSMAHVAFDPIDAVELENAQFDEDANLVVIDPGSNGVAVFEYEPMEEAFFAWDDATVDADDLVSVDFLDSSGKTLFTSTSKHISLSPYPYRCDLCENNAELFGGINATLVNSRKSVVSQFSVRCDFSDAGVERGLRYVLPVKCEDYLFTRIWIMADAAVNVTLRYRQDDENYREISLSITEPYVWHHFNISHESMTKFGSPLSSNILEVVCPPNTSPTHLWIDGIALYKIEHPFIRVKVTFGSKLKGIALRYRIGVI